MNKEELLKALINKQHALKENRASCFVPNGKQEEFSKSNAFINILSAGNGLGKTTIAINILVNLIYGPQNQFFDNDFYRFHRRPIRVRIASDPVVVEEKIVPELKKWLPVGTYISEKARRPFEAKWRITKGIGKGSLIDILTYNQDPKEFEAVELDIAWFDEPPPRAIMTPTIRGFRFGGKMFITMTPLEGAGFLFDQMDELKQGQEHTKIARRNIIFGSVESNCKEHGVRGILEHDHIEQMIAEYSEEERLARIEGKPMYQIGNVYKKFGDIHIIPPHQIPNDVTHYFAIDPHDSKPHALAWAYVNKYGEVYFYRDFSSSGTIRDTVRAMRNLEKGQRIKYRVMDAYFGNKPYATTGQTVKTEFCKAARDIGWHIGFIDGPTGPGSVEAGHEIVRDYLEYDAVSEIDATNCPKMYVFDNCDNIVRAFRNYTFIRPTGKARDRDGVSSKVGEKWKDFMDVVRFIVARRPRHITPEDEQLPTTHARMPTGSGY